MDDDFYDDEEGVVPVDNLRPSRRDFGPLPSQSGKAHQGSQGQGQGQGLRRRNAQQQRGIQQRQQPAQNRRRAAPVQGQSPQIHQGQGPQSEGQRSRGQRPSDPNVQRGSSQPRQPVQYPQVQGRGGSQQRARQQRADYPAYEDDQYDDPRSRDRDFDDSRGGQPRPTRQRRPRPQNPEIRNGRSQTPRQEQAFLRDLSARSRDSRSPDADKASSGWRAVVGRASGGVVTLKPGAEERHDLRLRHEVRRPVTEGTLAVFSRKGGVGKTTISAYLGLTLAAERGGRIVALDGDAEAGSLGWLLAPEAPTTLAELASAQPTPSDYATIRQYTAITPEGLEVIIGDPAEHGPISTIGLEAIASQLARHYDVSIFDTGAGVTRATGRVLVNSARALLLVMSPSVDSVRAAERTLAWIDERPGEAADPDARVIAVINGIPTNTKESHITRIEEHFSHRCDAVVRVPWDPHLAAGSTSVSLERLAKPTRRAFLELAATTVGALAHPARRPSTAGARRVS